MPVQPCQPSRCSFLLQIFTDLPTHLWFAQNVHYIFKIPNPLLSLRSVAETTRTQKKLYYLSRSVSMAARISQHGQPGKKCGRLHGLNDEYCIFAGK